MHQRGRKSAASLLVTNVNGDPPALQPPADLTPAERELFDQVVAATATKHFVPGDLPLLVSFVQATLLARARAPTPDASAAQISVWVQAVKTQAMLATRLRLAPQSRTDPKTVGREQVLAGPFPWDR